MFEIYTKKRGQFTSSTSPKRRQTPLLNMGILRPYWVQSQYQEFARSRGGDCETIEQYVYAILLELRDKDTPFL